MAVISRYSTIDKAVITATGNTLVMCGSTTEATINTSDMIKSDGTMTRDYSLAGSSAKINILDNSTILYAELVWLSTVNSIAQGAVDVRSIQDNPITFATPKETLSITPEYTSSYTSPIGTVDRLRACNVTNIIKNSMAGTYTVSNVPTSIPQTGLSETRAGWVLVVIYRNDKFNPKRIEYHLGIEAASPQNPLQASFTGFKTEANEETLKGTAITIFANGNPRDGVDTLKIGPSFANLTAIGNSVGSPNENPGTAPNNPWNSYSAGQINIADTLSSNKGLIDISGTLGTVNHDAFVPNQVLGARNKWDITCIDISNVLIPNQTQLSGQYTVNNTINAIEFVGFIGQVDSMAPDIVATLQGYDADGDDSYNINVNERIVYMVQIKNTGKTTANNVMLSTNLNPALQFIPNSVTVNGVTQTGANITTGINVGNIEPAGVTNVSFTVKAISLVSGGGTADTTVNYNYSFNSGAGSPTYINYANTNTLKLIIQDGSLNVVKSVSSNTTKVGDTLVYTTEITNIGSETAINMSFQDKINKYCSFVPGTVKINGVSFSAYNPNNGFNLSNLLPNGKITITFSVKVNSLSPNTVVENGALVTFSYLFDQYLVPITKTILSNTTSIQIQFSDIVAKRTANNYYPNVGDTVTYTLTLSNIGNIPKMDVEVIEPPVAGATFVDGSVYVNGVRKLGYNPFTGFLLDSIDAQTTTNVTYQVLINQIMPDQIIENIAKIPFKYQISSETPVISSEKDSNKVTTRTNYVIMTANESVDKDYATIGDTLYYSINITNTGNIDVINTIFLSTIQQESSFIPNTVAINGLLQPGYDPNLGFSLGTIPPENIVNVTFRAKVNSVPNPNIIYNNSNLIYSYKPDPNGAAITDTTNTNTVQTVINKASFTFTKYVDKQYAVIGDYLVYKCTIANTGTVDLKNVYFDDELANYVEFQNSSVYVNGVNYPEYNPDEGFSIGDIHPNDIIEILFGVQVKIAPPFGYIMNLGEMEYTYKLNPNSPTITETKKSNAVETKVVNGNLQVIKYASLAYATIGNTINYSFEVSNNGNVTVNNTVFLDQIPNGGQFVAGSVIVNGVSKPNYDPIAGFSLGNLNVGQVVSLSFDVLVNTVPIPNTMTNNGAVTYSYIVNPNMPQVSKTSTSNNVTTIINKGSATLTKVVDKSYATINDEVTYTITATNTGTVTINNVQFKDIIATGAEFVLGSIYIDDVNYVNYDPNGGFIIPNILPGGSSIVSFKAKIISIPTPPRVDNYATMNYKYKINPTGTDYTGSATSNTVTTYINQVMVTNTKSVDKLYAQVSDVLTYTSVIKNNGNVEITNTNFVDTLQSELTFNTGSVIINGTPYANFDPTVGFTLGTIPANGTVTVVFKATLSDLPEQGHVHNSSIIYYKYKIDPLQPAISSSQLSNTVSTAVVSGTLTIEKSVDRQYAKLTDIVKYKLVITNTGNTTLSNLFFKDIIQSESSFNSGTVFIDGVKKDNYNPNIGFNLDNLQVGKYTIIEFAVTVNSLPTGGKLYNTGDITYSYYVDPNASSITKTVTSNKTTVNVNDAIVTATKSVDKSAAKIGDILNFTVDIRNLGNVPAKFINFIDLLDSNISFNLGSVTINGVNKPTYNPNDGFSLDDIAANATTTVKFAATINTRPSDNIVENFATIDYRYKINPEDPYIEVSINTNITTTYVAYAELTLNKAVDKTYATVGNTLTYTVNIKNTGSVSATNLIFKDIVPSSTSFVPNTVVIDGVYQSNFDPNIGFALSDLVLNQYHTVSFDVLINSLPPSGMVENTADTSFSYKLTPTDPTQSMTATSNKVTTYVNLGKLNVTKAVDKNYATLGDTLKYTINVENVGNSVCKNIFFQDIIQTEATFVLESVKVNGTSKPNYNPNNGFALDDIIKDGKTTITFDVTVNALPADYIIRNNSKVQYKYNIDPTKEPIEDVSTSNTVTTNIRLGKLSVTKETNKAYATIDDIVSYTVNVVNTGNINADYVNFRDVIPLGLTFVTDSVKINGISKPGFDPYQSFTLGSIAPGASVIVKFDTKVTSVPSPSLVTNIANIVFSYKVDPASDYIVKQTDSNAVTTQINLGKLSLTKSLDKAYATIGDTITYTVEVSNVGNIDASNVIFTDGIVSDATFVSGSVTVNGESKPTYDPQIGFNLGIIASLEKSIVKFKVTVKSLPAEYTLMNTATATFSYKIDPSGEAYTKSTNSNSVYTIIVVSGLTATKVVNLAYATIGDTLDYSITIKNTGNTADKNLFFADTLSGGASFETGTVIIDDVAKPSLNPITGFNLPDLLAGNTTVVKFKVKVTSIDTSSKVTNFAVVNGVYKIDPNGPDYQIAATSNTVTTQINVGSLTNVKSVDKMYAKVGDNLTYTNVITNVGNVTATNTWFFDNLQPEIQFISGTVKINGILYPAVSPTVGFALGDLLPNQIVTLSFDVKINTLPVPPQIVNRSQAQFSYKVDPSGNLITKTILSNYVTTDVVKGEVNVNKIVDKTIATVGDLLVFNVNITNSGNVVANSVWFQDTPSTGASFKSGSVIVNGVPQTNLNPISGFTLGDIGIGNVVTVQFTAQVTEVPATNKITNQATINFQFVVDPKDQPITTTTYSNTTTTNIALGNLSVTKSVDKLFATIGEKLTYTVVIKNIGNIDATNVVFLDPTPQNSIFVVGSVTVNGLSKPTYNPSVGFDLNTMKPGEIITVVYKVEVV